MGLFDKFKKKTPSSETPSDQETAESLDKSYQIPGVAGVNVSSALYRGDNAFAQAKFYKFILLAMLGVTLFNTQSVNQLLNNERTHLVGLNGKTVSVGNTFVDQEYLIDVATFLTANYVSSTPAAARLQHAMILNMVHPTQYAEMQKRLDKRANTLKSLANTTLYANIEWGTPLQNKEQQSHEYVGVSSKLWELKYNANRLVHTFSKSPVSGVVEVRVYYTVENGRFWLVDIIEAFK